MNRASARPTFVDRYEADEDAVCLYPGHPLRDEASAEEALVHVYRHAQGMDFGLALQSILHRETELDWSWLQEQAEWPELAGIFAAIDSMTGLFIRNGRRQLPPG